MGNKTGNEDELYKKTQHELHRTQLLLNASLETRKDMIIIAIDNEYRYLFFNTAHKNEMMRVYGIEIAVGINIFDCITKKNDRIKLKSHFDRALAGESHSIIDSYGDIAYSTFESFFNPIHDEKRIIIGVTIFAQDITKRLQTEEELRNSKEQLAIVFNNTFDQQLLIAVHEGEFRIQNVNDTNINAIRNMGYDITVQDLIGKTIEEVLCGLFGLSEDVIDNTLKNFRQVLSTGKPVFYEEIQRLDNTHFFSEATIVPIFDKNKNCIKMIYTSHDITERKRLEQALQESEQRIRVAADNLEGILYAMDRDLRFTLSTGRKLSVFGLTSDKILGTTIYDYYNTKDPLHPRISLHLRALKGETIRMESTHQNTTFYTTISPIKNAKGEVIGILGLVLDITEKKKAEAKQASLNHRLNQMQKLESLGLLAGGIAHDFNNLLGGMFGYIDMAKESIDNNNIEDARKFLVKSFSVFDRTKALTAQLLTFAKGGAPMRKTMDLSYLIENSVQFSLSGSNVTSLCDIDHDLWLCDCDENQISQAIDNIIINAQQAMPVGGKIIITAKNVYIEQGHAPLGRAEGNFVKISIKDHGIGIAKEFLSQIYDPFFTTKSTGHGLGLATTYSIINRHNGWIDVESEPGQGTTFHILLPAAQIKTTPEVNRIPPSHKGSGTVLIMDDEDFMRAIESEMLKSMGYDVKEAISLFFDAYNSGNNFIFTILDLTIPNGLGGKDTIKGIRQIDDKAIVFVASGYTDDPILENPREYGFTAKIAKPFRKAELIEMLELHVVKSE